MTVFVSDSFTDSNNQPLTSHTGETGATWAAHTSRPNVPQISDANRLRGPTSSTTTMDYASGTPGSADYDVEADVVCVSDPSSYSEIAVMGRIATGAETGYYAAYSSFGYYFFQLRVIVAGDATTLGTWSDTIGVGNSRRFKLQMRGTAIKVFVDSGAGYVERISVTDSSVTAAGKAGVRSFYTAAPTNTTNYHLDNFLATDTVVASSVLPQRPKVIMPQAVHRAAVR